MSPELIASIPVTISLEDSRRIVTLANCSKLQTALQKAPPLLCGMEGDTITLNCGGEYSDKSAVQRALFKLIETLR